MFDTITKRTLLSIASLVVASCAGGPFNGPEHAMTVAETHPISVDSQVVTLTIDVDVTATDLSDTDHARLRAFADAYMRDGHGPLSITAPSGTAADFEGHEAAADIRAALNGAGVPWSALAGATYRTGGAAGGDQLILSYTHYVATASKCGVWSGIKGRDYRNLRTPNFGCATQNNIAAMLADPHDLIGPAPFAPGDAETTVRAFEAFRKGDVTAADIDTTINAQASGN
ncbi:MAG: CpaD family pilus assembly protein [Marinicaulis sp.]|nr:CpaD family pilus assembly protein [Marinicaulis sp.]